MLKKYSDFQKKTQYEKFDILYMGLGLCGETGELANDIKKIKRDDKNIITKKRKEKIIYEMGDIMWYYFGICNLLDISIEEILEKNIQKLTLFKD
jgi:NTP pyrophosphatase (non-canonical NTP hydrolase)